MIKKLYSTIKDLFLSLVFLGTKGESSLSENRITIFVNAICLFSTFAALYTYVLVKDWGAEGYILYTYFISSFSCIGVLTLNSYNRIYTARILSMFAINLAAWNALIIFGKSFNGYLLFYAALVFSVVGFNQTKKLIRWFSIGFCITGIIAADILSHKGYVPITGFHSKNAPLELLIPDSIILCFFIVCILMIEKSLSERSENMLVSLNADLEDIVKRRTKLLNEARKEAMLASQAKSQFLANTSHELRTPLGAIIGFVDLVIDTKPDDEEKEKYLKVIRRSANQLLEIVNEVLDLSKIEAQKLKIDKEVFSLYDLIEEVKSLMILKADNKGLKFDLKIEDDVPNYIYSDPLRLKQILINLTGNAIKFTEKGSVNITIHFEQKSLKDSFIHFDIKDTGPGITKSSAEELFKPFSQGDSTIVRKFGGTGLGLALSKSLSQLLGGNLSLLESNVNEGSTFRLELKCQTDYDAYDKKSSSSSKHPHPSELSLKGKKVLIVDDSPDNQYLVKQFVSLAEADIDIADDGQSAVEKVQNNEKYHIILMDLQMPVMDGYEAARKIKGMGCQTPIVAFSAHAMQEEKEKSKKEGFVAYLTKPVKRAELIETLHSHAE